MPSAAKYFPVIPVAIIECFRSRVIGVAECKGRGVGRVFGEEFVTSTRVDRCDVNAECTR